MNKKFKQIEWLGWILFILLMIPFVLLLMAEPSFENNNCHPSIWEKALVFTWLGSLLFSALLIVIGKYNKKKKLI